MSEFKLTINDCKTGKSYNKIVETDIFKGKKIREKISGDSLGLKGYELEIRGGSDKSGFPMRPDMAGQLKKKALLSGGVGVTIPREGARIRKTVRGNEISRDTVQINLKIIKYGAKKIDELLGTKEESKEETAGKKPEEVKKEEKKVKVKKEEVKKEEKKVEEKTKEVKEERKK